jgi:hypothetical protein
MLLSLRRAAELLSPAQQQLEAWQPIIACWQRSSTGQQAHKLRRLRVCQVLQMLSARRKLLDGR